jgi:hypothetical protein
VRIQDYQQHLTSLSFGKRLPTAVYVYCGDGVDLGEALSKIVATVAGSQKTEAAYNVIKFRTDELKISLLDYPDFMESAHPALRSALTVDLVTCRSRHISYIGNHNPPILHRKETFLPACHPRYEEFASLTRSEEAAGLYEQTATIGFKLNWERLLATKRFRIVGHTLESADGLDSNPEAVSESESESVAVARHKTALTRYELSRPVKTLLEYGMLKPDTTFFDYGCGQGSDVRGLRSLGHQAEGWDPAHRSDVPKHDADIVNLGYVLNVIEDPAERLEALVDAHRHCKKLLVVSGLITETVDMARATHFSDGVLTRANTFQKFFEQQELQQYIEDALDTSAVPVALGVFYVFRSPTDQQDFLSARSRRAIDWAQISSRLGLGGPSSLWKALYAQHKELLDEFGKIALALDRFPNRTEFAQLEELIGRVGSAKRALRAFVQGSGGDGLNWNDIRARFGIGQPAKRRWELLCEEHRELLEAFWNLMLQLGRLPEAGEFSQAGEFREKVGSAKQALRLFIQKGGGEDVRRAAENRKRDLLVYVALANLRKRVPFGHLSASLRADIRAFFGNYTEALKKGVDLLFAAGDCGEIELACEELKVGWQDEQALYIHRSILDELPPVLRAYVGCATALFGDVSQADVIKLHKSSGKATFLVYDDFDGKPLPELRQRIKVNLRTRWVQVFDHSAERQVLYFKERFVSANDPGLDSMKAFSAKLRKLGFDEATVGRGPLRPELDAILVAKGLNENLNPRRRPESAT